MKPTEEPTKEQLLSELKETRDFFVPMAERHPEWDWARESIMSCDILKLLFDIEPFDPNLLAYYACIVKKEFKMSHPAILPNYARKLIEWAKQQEGVVPYQRVEGCLAFFGKGRKVEAP